MKETIFNCNFSIQDASKAKIKWAVGAYNRWRAFRSEIFHQRYTTKVTHYNREIKPIDASAKDVDEMQADLCDFIVEIRKENGEQYPSSSMYDLISGLSLYLEREHGFTNKLVSGAFRSVRNTLDNIMKERTAEGVEGCQRGIPSWKNMRRYCGRRVYWGRTVQTRLGKQYFFLIGVRFGLRGLKEQYELRRYPDSQINIVKIDGKDALVYRKFQSKTRQGGISDRGKNPARVSYSFCTGVSSRCLVELFRKYLFLGPRGSYHWPRFYVQTDPKWEPGSDYWYTNMPVGKNTLGGILKT